MSEFDDLWANNAIQFARLLAEIQATFSEIDYDALCESMDLTRDDIDELFDRAMIAWELAKDVLT